MDKCNGGLNMRKEILNIGVVIKCHGLLHKFSSPFDLVDQLIVIIHYSVTIDRCTMTIA